MAEQRQTPTVINRIPPSVTSRPEAVADTLTPRDIWLIIRRHIWLIICMTILGFILGGVSWFLLRRYAPKYRAQTFIEVLPVTEKDPMTIGGSMVNKDIQYGARVSMANLIKQQSTLQALIDRDKIQQTEWFKSFGDIKSKRIQKAVKDLKKHFGAHALRDGDQISVSMTCGDKAESALIVNEMVRLFLASQGSTKKEDIAEKLARLDEQRIRVQRDLAAAQKALDDVRRRWGFTDLEERNFQNTITLKLNQLETERDELVLDIQTLQTNIETLKKQATGPVNEQVGRQVETDPIMVSLARQLTGQQTQLAGLLTKFGENHRVVRQFRELIDQTQLERTLRKAEIAEMVRQANLKNAQDEFAALQKKLEELETLREEVAARKSDFDLARVQYQQRLAIRDEREKMLDSVKAQIEKLKIMHDDPETPKVQFVGLAPEPLEISSPKWQIYFPGGMMLGFMLGTGLAFLIELLNDLVRTPRDVTRHLRIALLGVIPDANEDEQIEDIDLYHVAREAPYSVTSESYRRLRTNLKLSSNGNLLKALLVTSGMVGDGKTSMAVNLATTLVAEERRVLLIDASFWKPSLHQVFSTAESQDQAVEPSEFGLSTMLAGLCGYQEIIRSGGIEGFDIIDAGPLPFNPAELLGSPRMEQLIQQQKKCYDYVIIDGPPVLMVGDVKVLAKFVDGTILVFNANTTKRGAAQRVIRELKEINVPIAGCVLMAVKALKGGYFAEQFRSHLEYQKVQLAHSV